MKDPWQEILELGRKQAISVTIPAVAEAPKPKKLPWRPRIRGVLEFEHYEGFTGQGRPRCRVRGCGKRLRRNQKLGCTPEHEAQLLAQARTVLEKFNEGNQQGS